ncbi:MAG: peptidoglycan DD-metalloendopeptidase family protein, partial [Tenericutes bacterium]|nr:peptidoglycan DD-metalloendopeptidase family protein [Mycoplasmatota bacterium]
EIVKNENEIKESQENIILLNEEIVVKQKEIDSLLSFLQVSNGENVYLEYVFEATSFTDFIYRSAVVEQLTKYNDELIDEMYNMIEENKQLQIKLKEKIKKSEAAIDKLEVSLKSQNLDMNDIDEEQRDVNADIKARKVEIAYYEKTYTQNGCSEDIDIYECVGVPYANEFTRPLDKGTITSEFGMRFHPTKHYYTMHNGIDIGIPTGNKVYSSAAGIVNKIVVRSSCGGNMVYIQHNIDGTKYRTVYMHLHTVKVKVGDVVSFSTVIGTSGGGESYDGCSTGPHLHFGILKGWTGYSYYNPRTYINFPKLGSRFTTRF